MKNTLIRNIALSFIKCFFEILFYSLPYLVGEAEADGGEGAAIEDAIDNAVIYCNLGALVLLETRSLRPRYIMSMNRRYG